MRKLRSSLIAKICAWVLAAAVLAGISVTGILVVFGAGCGLYESGEPDFFSSRMAYNEAFNFAIQAAGQLGEEKAMEELEAYSRSEQCNFLYRLETMDGEQISATLESSSDVAKVYDYMVDGYRTVEGQTEMYHVTVAIKQ